jgi:hypothetical protein
MARSFAMMAAYFNDHSPNEYRPGRTTSYSVPDKMAQGQSLIYSDLDGEVLEDNPADITLDTEDLLVELDYSPS